MYSYIFLFAACLSGLACATTAAGELPLADAQVAALANEVNGETAKHNLESIVQFHRQRGSRGFHSAAELVAERAKAYGLTAVEILQFPADGKVFYGTQRSRMGWDADKGELTEVRGGSETPVASFAAMSVALAEDSESAELMADLVDAGNGDSESDYAGKDVKGKIVLVAHQPSSAQALAIGQFGAAGMVSYAPNQTTAWSGENQEQVR
ncbi:MAG TPA: PA domain-containing protein, partial [Rhodanobacteraceae bacterium]|nr:PA domain-containing protein [Rhodanobacteraceae bacterium]